MTTPQQIVRCLKRDWGNRILDLQQGAEYCHRIAAENELGAFTNKEDSPAYRDAAKLLRAEADERLILAQETADKELYE